MERRRIREYEEGGGGKMDTGRMERRIRDVEGGQRG